MGPILPPATPSYRVDKVWFYESGGQPFCRLESDGVIFDLHGDWATLIAGLESGKGLLETLAKHQAVAAMRSELSVVPLCQLCTKHDLPRD